MVDWIAIGGAEAAGDHGGVDLKGIIADQRNEQAAHHQGQQHRQDPKADALPPCQLGVFDNADQRLFLFSFHIP